MKIISKYKDFYDYIVQDHDADLVYVRKIDCIHDYFDDLFKKNNDMYMPYYNKYYGYNYTTYSLRSQKDGDVALGNYIFGIYPFVYSQPYIDVRYSSVTGYEEHMTLILPKSIIDNLLNDETKTQGYAELKRFIMDEYNKIQYKSTKSFKINLGNGFDISLKRNVWKIDCKEIFYKLNAPVFIKYYEELFENGCYWNDIYLDKNQRHYVTNISFQKLDKNILKYWYDDLMDLNTYINIENFLWSVKQEPEANPDNKTKIVAHGFDLKTSFRKM